MRAKDLRELSDQELAVRERELVEEISHLTMRRAMGQLESPARLRQLRRDLARLKTIVGERQRTARA